ncbi:hypothetical protein [Pseudomonas monteilii]|uniref:hypothetical protein n=1 Tax=Pseudomonas monteilii TaxID=76759 RepID=UPI00383BA036
MRLQVRALSEAGLGRFSAWLNNPVGAAPKEILESADDTRLLESKYYIDSSKRFSTSFELGAYLSCDVFIDVTDFTTLSADANIWAWLSLAFIDDLVRRDKHNEGKLLAKSHYVHESPRLAYRLIVRTAWQLFFLHGEVSRVALGSIRSPWGDMAEQMTSRQEMYSHQNYWAVAKDLYTLADGSLKTGVTTRRPPVSKRGPKTRAGLGCVQRLPFTFKQFERTYNLRKMPKDDILRLLPNEYSRWRVNDKQEA